MNTQQKLKLLKKLYLYKSIGYEYIEDEIINNSQPLVPSPINNMEELKKVVMDCTLCELAKSRKNVVFGEGDENSDILFIGEGPGAMEDEMGKPFVGNSGEMLTRIIENVLDLKREDIFIANIVKCRPPDNRVPSLDEVELCKGYLFSQIEFIKPKIIVTLGGTAYKYLTNDSKSYISKVRGETINFKNMILIPTFHPSYLLRKPSMKKVALIDFLKIKRLIKDIK